jgi:hypothetical protein
MNSPWAPEDRTKVMDLIVPATVADGVKGHCDECDWTFTCWQGRDKCRKKPAQPAEPSADGYVPTPDEARAILSRFNASHFDLKDREHARYRIPADPKHDDDIRMGAFIKHHEATLAALDKAERERDDARNIVNDQDSKLKEVFEETEAKITALEAENERLMRELALQTDRVRFWGTHKDLSMACYGWAYRIWDGIVGEDNVTEIGLGKSVEEAIDDAIVRTGAGTIEVEAPAPVPVAKVPSWPERVEQQVRDLFFGADIRNKPVPDGAIADLIRSHVGDLEKAKGAGL